MKRGEIWIGNLNPNKGAEVGKARPLVVIEADWSLAQNGRTVIILPLSTQVDELMATVRLVLAPRGQLLKRSQVLTDQPRAIDRRRLSEGPIAFLSSEELAVIEKSLTALLGIAPAWA